MNSTIRSVFRTAALIAALMTRQAPASQLVLVDKVPLPFAYPTYGLNFDEGTHTLWGVNNPPTASQTDVWHFDLHGNLLSSWPAIPQSSNLTGIGLDVPGQRVFYYQNLGPYLQEATMDGTWRGTIQLPRGYQNNTLCIQYDQVSGQIVMPYSWTSAGPQGFLHVSLESGAPVFTEGFDFSRVVSGGYIRGFYLTQDSYWLLGNSGSTSTLVQVDRASLQIDQTYDIPGVGYAGGLTRDPGTGRFYMYDLSNSMMDVFEVPEPSALSLIVLGVLSVIVRRAKVPYS